MSQVDNIDSIAFSTGFLPDKLLPQKFTGSFTLTASGGGGSPKISTTTFNNPYGADTLPVFLYSIDGTNWYDGGQNIQTSTSTTASATAYTDGTTVGVVGVNFTTTIYTLQYRLGLISDD